jgi:hypothetical protein
VSDGLAGGRRNVVIAILDDHGHCQFGFMGGRCAGKPGVPLIRCEPGVVCPGSAPCVHGYCRQCTEDSACGAGAMCLEGLCSPRAACSGDFECARGIGECGDRHCAVSGAPCDEQSPCAPTDRCIGQCERVDSLAIACSTDRDCNDECTGGLCARTPKSCGPNSDCTGSPDYRCTTSDEPLRLNDLSCRYRDPGDQRWEYVLSGPLPEVGEQTVLTPHIDALARQGVLFSRARVNGQNCKPTRAAMLLGTFLRHRDPSNDETCPTGADETFACRVDDDTAVVDPADEEFHEIAAGKTELGSADRLGFDTEFQGGSGPSFGKFTCDVATCGAALANGTIPQAAIQDGVPASLDGVLDHFRARLAGPNRTLLTQPVLLWYAPKIPHEGTSAGPYFEAFYRGPDTSLDEGEQHLARTSRFDAGLEALNDELRRTCVCPAPVEPPAARPMESLYDHTTVIVTADNAFLLPQAKNDSGRGSENAHRTGVIINDPVHRVPGSVPRVLDSFTETSSSAPEANFAGSGAPDLFPTILDYATGGGLSEDPPYPFSESLRPLANGTATVRKIYYGHAVNGTSMDKTPVGQRAYMIPGPGVLGRCEGTGTVCLVGAGVGCAASLCKRYVCANDPTRTCGSTAPSDADCAEDYCPDVAPKLCSVAAPIDFRTRACGEDIDCVPAGICRPVMLKAVQTGSATARNVTELYDLNADPDETDDLIDSSGNPLSAIESRVNNCLKKFWCNAPGTLDTATMDNLVGSCGAGADPCS